MSDKSIGKTIKVVYVKIKWEDFIRILERPFLSFYKQEHAFIYWPYLDISNAAICGSYKVEDIVGGFQNSLEFENQSEADSTMWSRLCVSQAVLINCLVKTKVNLPLRPCIRRLSPQYERRSKLGVLTKRYDNSLFLRSKGLIWRGTAYFVQNNTTIILPGDTRRTTSELPCRAPATHFWRQNRSLETQNGSYFSLFANWYGFWKCNFQWEKLPDFEAFPDLFSWRQATRFFSRLLNPDWSIQISRAPAVCKVSDKSFSFNDFDSCTPPPPPPPQKRLLELLGF